MSVKKDYQQVVAEAQKQGFKAHKTGKGSKLMLLAPDGVNMVRCAATPSDYKGLNNLIAELRKYGFTWKGH